MKHTLSVTIAMLCLALLAQAQTSKDNPKLKKALQRPNIVFIFADDLGWQDVGYNDSSGFIETPNLDKLAREGRRQPDATLASLSWWQMTWGFPTSAATVVKSAA